MKWRDSIIWWHRGSSNLAFADGHSIKRKWSRETKDEFTARGGGGWEPVTAEGKEDLKYMLAGWAK
jgi:prepilin-type processing-associated H-X9-DG protein